MITSTTGYVPFLVKENFEAVLVFQPGVLQSKSPRIGGGIQHKQSHPGHRSATRR